jgi:hypothetical protein
VRRFRSTDCIGRDAREKTATNWIRLSVLDASESEVPAEVADGDGPEVNVCSCTSADVVAVHYGLVHRDAGDNRPSCVCSTRSDSDMAVDGCDTQYDALVHGHGAQWSATRNTGDVVHETRPGVEMVINLPHLIVHVYFVVTMVTRMRPTKFCCRAQCSMQ